MIDVEMAALVIEKPSPALRTRRPLPPGPVNYVVGKGKLYCTNIGP